MYVTIFVASYNMIVSLYVNFESSPLCYILFSNLFVANLLVAIIIAN